MEALDRIRQDAAAGLLHLLVLAAIDRHAPIHGYALLRRIHDAMAMPLAKEGTVYPLLARLERDGLLLSAWGQATHGPRRKEYILTPAGKRLLKDATDAWRDLNARADLLLE